MHGKKNNILLKWIRRKIDQFLPKKRILSWDNSCTRATTTEKQQNCSHKTWYMHIEIVCIGINKKKFCFCAEEKQTMSCFVIVIFWCGWEKLHRENEKSVVFPESRYVTYTYFGPDFSTRRWNFPTRWLDFFLIGEKLLLSFSPMCFCQRSKFRFRGITLVISIEHN